MKKIPLFIKVGDHEDENECSFSCPFYDDGYCLLFQCDLEESILPPGYSWADVPYRQRNIKCMEIF